MYRFFNSFREFERLELNLKSSFEKCSTISSSFALMQQELKTLCIRRAVVRHVMQMLQENQISLSNTLFYEGIASMAKARQRGELGFLAGCIANDKFSLIHKVLVKQLRGNLVLQTKELPHDEEDEKELEAKTIFTILIHGRAVREKVKLLCSSLGALMVECGEENAGISTSIRQMHSELNSQTFRLTQIIANTKELLESKLKVVPLLERQCSA